MVQPMGITPVQINKKTAQSHNHGRCKKARHPCKCAMQEPSELGTFATLTDTGATGDFLLTRIAILALGPLMVGSQMSDYTGAPQKRFV